MATRAELIARLVATRLSALVRDLPAVVINAAPEYCTLEIARELARQRFPEGCAELLGADATSAKVRDELRRGNPLLSEISLENCDHGWVDIMQQESPTATQTSLRLIIISGGGQTPCTQALEAAGYLVLDHRDLVLTGAELKQLLPEGRRDPGSLGKLVSQTGGVPLLAAAFDIDQPDDNPELTAVAQAWAARGAAELATQPLVKLHAWWPVVSAKSVVALAEPVLGARPSPAEVSVARQHEMITARGMGRFAMPEALARAIRQAAIADDPHAVEALEQAVINQALTSPEVSRIAAVRVLLYLHTWAQLDQALANSLFVGAFLTAEERSQIVERWPVDVPRQWPQLGALREFCAANDSWVGGQFDTVLAEMRRYTDLVGMVDVAGSWALPDLQRWTEVILNPRVQVTQASCVQRVDNFTDWLTKVLRSIEASPIAPGDDQIALLFGLQGIVARIAVAFGELGSALNISRVTKSLLTMIDPDYELYSSMTCRAAAMNALTAATAGLPQLASAHILEYERVARELNFAEAPTEWMVDCARRVVAVYRGEVQRFTPSEHGIMVTTPLLSHTEAMEILMLNGPQAATDWLQTTLNRASWSEVPPWLWWPAEHLLILLHAQAGRVGAAQAWLGRVELPRALATVVRAHVDIAAGRLTAAMKRADNVLGLGNLPHSWHLLAVGAKLACLAGDEERADERLALLASEDWSMALGVVATFPPVAQEMVTDLLQPSLVKGLPGLHPEELNPAPDLVKLTQRQAEVLAQLATDATMPEIAKRMYISPETVRSTAKHLYRRMGVHGRQAAVDLGRALGLI